MFVERDAQAIYDGVLQYVETSIGETLAPGDERRIFLESLCGVLVSLYSQIDITAMAKTRMYAEDEFLDAIGETYGCERIAATKATASMAIKNTSSSTVTVPAGTKITNDDMNVVFIIADEITIPANTETDIDAVAEEAGADSNGYSKGSITTIVGNTALSAVLSVTNLLTTSGGADAESDDDYRERIGTVFASYSSGTAGGYDHRIKTMYSDITDTYVTPGDGNNVNIYVAPGRSTTEIEDIQESIRADDYTSVTDIINVYNGEAVSATITVNISVSSAKYNSLCANADSITAEYKKYQNNKFGMPYNPGKLISLLMDAGAWRVKLSGEPAAITNPAQFYSVDLTYLILEDDEPT